MNSKEIKNITLVGVTSAISTVLMMIEFSILPQASFLKYDFSDIPALYIAFFCGPVEGIFTIFIKNFLHYMLLSGDPMGHLMSIIAGLAFIIPASLIYKSYHSFRGAIAGLVAGYVIFVLTMLPMNYFVVSYVWDLPSNLSVNEYIVKLALPFNIIKGLINVVVISIIYKRFSKLLHGFRE